MQRTSIPALVDVYTCERSAQVGSSSYARSEIANVALSPWRALDLISPCLSRFPSTEAPGHSHGDLHETSQEPKMRVARGRVRRDMESTSFLPGIYVEWHRGRHSRSGAFWRSRPFPIRGNLG